jgi:hypothetical protein
LGHQKSDHCADLEVRRACAGARAVISFKPHDILFDLVREHGRWFIDDISETRVGSNRWTMSKILTHAPDAFPDEMK